jgi:hypothetical protein
MATVNPTTRLAGFPPLNSIFDMASHAPASAVSRAFRDLNRQRMIEVGNRLVADFMIGARFLQVLAPPYANLDRTNPAQISACFAALYRDQMEILPSDIRYTPLRFEDSFSLDRWVIMERRAARSRDNALRDLWNKTDGRRIDAPHSDSPAGVIRAWLHDPQNAEASRMITHLSDLRSPLSREVLLLPNIRTMSARYFDHVPSILAELPNLSRVTFSECPNIRVLPDDVLRHIWSGWWIHLGQIFHEVVGSNYVSRGLSLGLDPNQLNEMPFALWVKETFSLPYLPRVIYHLIKWLEDFEREVRNTGLAGPMHVIMWTVAIVGLAVTMILNSPMMLWNLLLIKAIEPIVTFFRDHMGYSRMVHVRDQPQGEM